MQREAIEAHCGKICPERGCSLYCAFAPFEELNGFIDTSADMDGSRGIAFCSDRMYVNTDGVVEVIEYSCIESVSLVSSFEDVYADELSVSGKDFEVRVSDYSLDKLELKRLLEELCREQPEAEARRREQLEQYADIIAKKLSENSAPKKQAAPKGAGKSRPDHPKHDKHKRQKSRSVIDEKYWLEDDPIPVEGDSPVIEESETAHPPFLSDFTGAVDIPEERAALPEDYTPLPIPEEKIDWISGARRMTVLKEEEQPPVISEQAAEEEAVIKEVNPQPLPLEVMSGVVDRIPVIGNEKPKAPKEEPKPEPVKVPEPEPEPAPEPEMIMFSEQEMRERIENMGDEEMMRFLADTLSEINDDAPFFEQTAEPVADFSPESAQALAAEPREVIPPKPKLTTEPVWGDIYIKASKSLRELCESGRLTMEQMEKELKAQLISSAEAFEQITEDESRVPKVLIPKITELRAAVADFDTYFGYGEDIAVRAMFFMLYQMLTYADRIEESPETKDRLNDFFRRFGSAVITLSMLDMRV